MRIGPFGSLLHQDDYVINGTPLVNPSHIKDSKVEIDANLTVSKEKMKALSAYVMFKGDIVLGRRGEIGRCALITENEEGFLCGTGSIFIRPVEGLNSKYLVKLISSVSIKRVLEDSAKGITMKNLNSGIVEDLEIPIPPIELQNQFAAIVEKTEALKKEYTESLRELERLFGSLSQRAFKGELELSKLDIAHLMPLTTEDSEPIVIKEEPKEKEVKTKPPKNEKPEQKRPWDKVSSQGVAEWVKKEYQGYHFSSEMLMRFLRKKYLTIVNYHSSEELKKYPRLHGTQDFKEFIFSAVSKENPFLKLEQVFYNAEQENIPLQITEEDFELIKDRSAPERSGIYFKIVEN